MKTWRCLVALGTVPLLLVGCGRFSQNIGEKLENSTVLIYYDNREGHGSGFVVEGEKGVCTAVTARHVTLNEEKVKIQTPDDERWEAINIRRFPDHDLAVVEFETPDNNCPYPSLKIGDSDQVSRGDLVQISGYFRSGNRLVNHLVSGRVTALDELPEGYGIAYDATTGGGMSGGPVMSEKGEVIAIHGLSDQEVNELSQLVGESSSGETESEASVSPENVFKWGIPTNIYQSFLAEVPKNTETDELSAEDYLSQGNNSYAQGRYEEAIASYDQAIEIQPDYALAWYNRGVALEKLEKYEDAIASYDQAIKFQPDYAFAWHNRGNALQELGKYEDAIASYDQAIKIQPDDAMAWNNRGWALENLKRYDEALESYDKALQFDPNYQTAINNRKNLLEKLGR